MSDIAIRASNLGKQYRIGAARQRADTLRDAIAGYAGVVRRRLGRNGKAEPDNLIWALKDVSFEVKRGEVMGVIGRNGAGKSTLLKILSRITEPTTGEVELDGRVGSLLEVGTGFHAELTGRENIYLNGAILGMKRHEIQRKFDEIVDFSGVEQFIDTPVKRYSSGMYLRLAFAVAAHMDTEILLVDEVLAVGDAEFQKKCLGTMDSAASEGRTVLVVSHSMAVIHRLCRQSICLENGIVAFDGPTTGVIRNYLVSNVESAGRKLWPNGVANEGVTEFRIDEVAIENDEGLCTATVDVRRTFRVRIGYRILEPMAHGRVGFLLKSVDGLTVFESYDSDSEELDEYRSPGAYTSTCDVPGNLLATGEYLISVNAGVPNRKNLAFLDSVLHLSIEDTGAVGAHLQGLRHGVIRPKLKWSNRQPETNLASPT